MAQSRWKMGTALAEAGCTVGEKCWAGSTGAGVRTSTVRATIKNWFCETGRAGIAGSCEPDCGLVAQHFMSQQHWAPVPVGAHFAGAAQSGLDCAANICPTNNRQDNMTSSLFTILVSPMPH